MRISSALPLAQSTPHRSFCDLSQHCHQLHPIPSRSSTHLNHAVHRPARPRAFPRARRRARRAARHSRWIQVKKARKLPPRQRLHISPTSPGLRPVRQVVLVEPPRVPARLPAPAMCARSHRRAGQVRSGRGDSCRVGNVILYSYCKQRISFAV